MHQNQTALLTLIREYHNVHARSLVTVMDFNRQFADSTNTVECGKYYNIPRM